MTITLRPYQIEAVTETLAALRAGKNPVLCAPTGCHAFGHPILMADGGIKPVQEIVAGDQVMGPDSRPRRVLAIHHGETEMVKVSPKRGARPFVVSLDHVFSIQKVNEGVRYPCSSPRIENCSVRRLLSEKNNFRHVRKIRRVSVEFPRASLPIDPWVIGYILGDGSLINGISITDEPGPCIDRAISAVLALGDRVRISRKTKNKAVSVHVAAYGSPSRYKKGHLKMLLSDFGLIGKRAEDKFIPRCYLISDRSQRLDLLSGLLDSDGHYRHGGYDWISKSELLANDIVFLARSLGFQASITEAWKSCQSFSEKRRYFRVSLSGNMAVLNGHSAKHQHPIRKQKKNHAVSGVSLQLVGSGRYYGFELDGDHLYLDGQFIVHHNSGKSLMGAAILAELAQDRKPMSGLSVTHVRELIAQNLRAYHSFANGAGARTSVYSAGLDEKDLSGQIVFAGVQSLVRAPVLDKLNPAIVVCDEVHRVNPKESTQYGQVFKTFSASPRCGLSATPYRSDSGLLHEGPGALFDTLINNLSVARLQADGYLAPLVGVLSRDAVDTRGVHVRAGEFVNSELEEIATDPKCVQRVCAAIKHHADASGRKKILVFGVSVLHAQCLAEELTRLGVPCGFVCGAMSTEARDAQLEAFRTGAFRAMANRDVLTTGFDLPEVDCLAMVRPTMSKSLWTQIVGRCLRTTPGKANALLLDFGQNQSRHGDLDGLPRHAIVDEPAIDAQKRKTKAQRDDKAYVFRLGVDAQAIGADDGAVREARVYGMDFVTQLNKKNPTLRQVMATYKTDIGKIPIWLLPEHPANARWLSGRWFARRGLRMPLDAIACQTLARTATRPESISVRKEGQYWRVLCEHFAVAAEAEPD